MSDDEYTWRETPFYGLDVALDDDDHIVIKAVDEHGGEGDVQFIITPEIARALATRIRLLVG